MKRDIYFFSRICYIVEETIGYLISLLITGAYLAKLCQSLDFSDSTVAILSSFTSLGFIFQLAAIALVGRGRYKKKVTLLFTLNQLMFTMLYVIPIFPMNTYIKGCLFIFMLLCGHFLTNAAASPRTAWFMALVPDSKRGSFTSLKEAISLICGIIFQFAMGTVADYYDEIGNERAFFIVCGITIFVMTIIHILSLVLAKEKEPETTEKLSIFKGTTDILRDTKFRPVLIYGILWAVCSYVGLPFLGTYQIKELSFSMTFVAFLAVVYAVARIAASVFLGKYADKTSFSKMLVICYITVSLSFLAGVFTLPSNGHVLYTIHHILYAMAMGGINSAEINLVYDLVSPDKRISALAVKSALCGLVGFLTTVLASPVITFIQANNNSFLGFNMYAQQLLMFISFILSIVLILFAEFKLTKLKKWSE